MNHTPQRTRRKTTKRKRQRRKPLRGRFALLGAAVLLVLLLLRCGADEPQPGSAAADETAGETTAETQPVPATQAADPPSKDDPLLLLVSRAHPLAEDYAPELTQLHDWPYSIAAIAYEPLRQMLAAGRAEGLSFTVASAYRSTDSQRQLFDEDVEARVSEGMTEDEAREETARWTMPPGCSEHETGLAVDIVATDNQRLDDTQEQTPETIWLHENCWRFGFILRYPAGKEDVTGMMGLSLRNVTLTVTRGGKTVFQEMGEMLFTHFGVSGPLVLSASANMQKGSVSDYRFSIDLKPALDRDTLDKRILSDLTKYAHRDLCNALDDLLPKSLIPYFIGASGVSDRKKAGELTREERLRLVEQCKGMTLTPTKFRPMAEAIITHGGVSVKAVQPGTMELRELPGVYVCGELLDTDAYTGGFNLQIAFSTAYVAGRNAAGDGE